VSFAGIAGNTAKMPLKAPKKTAHSFPKNCCCGLEGGAWRLWEASKDKKAKENNAGGIWFIPCLPRVFPKGSKQPADRVKIRGLVVYPAMAARRAASQPSCRTGTFVRAIPSQRLRRVMIT
jgi:hypothetical protein